MGAGDGCWEWVLGMGAGNGCWLPPTAPGEAGGRAHLVRPELARGRVLLHLHAHDLHARQLALAAQEAARHDLPSAAWRFDKCGMGSVV